MKSRSFAIRFSSLLLLGLFFGFTAVAAPTKSIRLRNETITPASSPLQSALAAAPTTDSPVTGLFLLQFNGALPSAARDELRNRGVELLQYVPEDAFVAKFEGARVEQIRQLDFVRWVGPYRPEHKIHLA